MSTIVTDKVKNKNMTIRINAEEYRRIQDFARFQGTTVSGLVLDAVWAQMEDCEDIKAVEEYLKNPDQPVTSHAAFMKELGL